MKTLSLAVRNLLRNRHRSLAAILTMVVGMSAVLLFGGFDRFVTCGLQTGYVQYAGHFQIQHQDYFLYGSGNPAAYGIPDYQRVINAVKSDPVLAAMVTVVTPTLDLNGIAGNSSIGVSRSVIARGVVVDEQNQLRQWNDYHLTGANSVLPLTGTNEDAAITGNGLARVLQLCKPLNVPNCPHPLKGSLGTETIAPSDIVALSDLERGASRPSADTHIQLLVANIHGAPNVAELNVVKTQAQGAKEWDDVFIALHLRQAQRLLFGSANPQVTGISVQLHHTDQMPQAKVELERLLNTTLKGLNLNIVDFSEIFPFYGQAVQMFGVIFIFIAVLIGVVVLFTISNTMRMAVIERTVEIGTLRALGLRRHAIHRLFVYEGVMLGTIGAILGVAFALVLAWVVNNSGITWIAPGQVRPVVLTVRLWGEMGLLISTAVGLTMIATVSAWWPARKAAQMNIVEALRHV